MHHANQINSGAFIMEKVFQENAKNALVHFLIQEVQSQQVNLLQSNKVVKYVSSTENSRSNHDPKIVSESHIPLVDKSQPTHTTFKPNDDLEQLVSTHRKTELHEKLFTSKEDQEISSYPKEDFVPMISKIKHINEYEEHKEKVFSHQDPETVALSPKTYCSIERPTKPERASSKS